MTLKQAIANSLLMFVAATCVVLIVRAISPTPAAMPSAPGIDSTTNTQVALGSGATPTLAVQDGIKVYYLHGNLRCSTCRAIESNAKIAVETGFADQLKSRQIEWAAINYESPGNEHYATDYEVVAPTVVMAKYIGGEQKAWKALPEVWEHVGDDAALMTFVQRSLQDFIGDSPVQTPTESTPVRSTNGSVLSTPRNSE